jgi:hypothetical protein
MPTQPPIVCFEVVGRNWEIPFDQSTGRIFGVKAFVPNVDTCGVSQVPLGTFTTQIPYLIPSAL